jgi:flagellar protein FlaG
MNVSPAGTTAIAQPRHGLSISGSGSLAPLASVESTSQPESAAAPQSVDHGAVASHLEDAVSAINAFLKPISNNLEFSVDEGSGKTVVKLVDTETNTVLRQYPTKEALAIAKDIDRFQGLLINTEA